MTRASPVPEGMRPHARAILADAMEAHAMTTPAREWAEKAGPVAERLEQSAEQAQAAIRSTYGLPLAVIPSDTHAGKMGLWCDNGLAGIGQVAVFTSEFGERQALGVVGLANNMAGVANTLPEAATLLTTALSSYPAAEAERDALVAEVARLREALELINDGHLPDQPATSALDETEWALRHIRRLRALARSALGSADNGK